MSRLPYSEPQLGIAGTLPTAAVYAFEMSNARCSTGSPAAVPTMRKSSCFRIVYLVPCCDPPAGESGAVLQVTSVSEKFMPP